MSTFTEQKEQSPQTQIKLESTEFDNNIIDSRTNKPGIKNFEIKFVDVKNLENSIQKDDSKSEERTLLPSDLKLEVADSNKEFIVSQCTNSETNSNLELEKVVIKNEIKNKERIPPHEIKLEVAEYNIFNSSSKNEFVNSKMECVDNKNIIQEELIIKDEHFNDKNNSENFTLVHSSNGSDERIIGCAHCDHKEKIKKNLLKIHETTFKCDNCKYEAKTKCLLKQHHLEKHEENPPMFKCHDCDYKAIRKEHLNKHFVLTHETNPPTFNCPHCDYKAKIKKYLRQHIARTHEKKILRGNVKKKRNEKNTEKKKI